jgi:hypothetical protein
VAFAPVVSGYIIQPNGITISSDAPTSPITVDLEGQAVLINPAYIVTNGVENGYFAIGPLLRKFSPPNFICEEFPHLEKLIQVQGPGYESTILRIELQYEDRGECSVKITGTSERGQVAFDQKLVGTATPVLAIKHAMFDLKLEGELITLEIDPVGPLSIVAIIPRFISGGEVKG